MLNVTSGFLKTTKAHVSVVGSKLKNNILVVSSGIPSLDYIIGGGLPTTGIFAVEEDVLASYSRVLTKYFIAEGVVCQHHLFIASADQNPEEIVKELPQPCTLPSNDTSTKNIVSDEMKIAWRYESLGRVESSFASETNFGHHFDLSKHIEHDTIKKCNITYCDLRNICRIPNQDQSQYGFKNNLYYYLLTRIKTLLSNPDYDRTATNKSILRISIQSLGSPIWFSLDCDNEPINDAYGNDLIKFMYCLRILLQDKNAVAFVTLPSHLFDEDYLMSRILYSIDNAVRIESFAGSDKETNPLYSEYHGLFHLTKLSAMHSLESFVPSSLDLAFKLKRKKFVIEKLHLPPELQESSEREQDDITAIPKTCGGFKKRDIEF